MSTRSQYEIDVADVEYLRHGDQPLLARLYAPRGDGPFPCVIDLHGGAWCNKDRLADEGTCVPLAQSGVVVLALDFRMPPEAKYPASMQDVNYAVRWAKSQASKLMIDPKRVALMGVSSGGHQAMLTAMRPNDVRYAALRLPAGSASVDASVRAAILCWPVIDPLGRYRYAKNLKEEGRQLKHAENWIANHDKYWADENEMAEGNPNLALTRGEKGPLPPVLYLQGTADIAHPVVYRDEFVTSYRKAGGSVDLQLFQDVGEAFVTNDPTSPQAKDAIAKIIAFTHQHLG